MLTLVLSTLIIVFGGAAWDVIKKRRALAKEFDERKARLVFAMRTTTTSDRLLVLLDMDMRAETVLCANGHTYVFDEFYCADGADTKVVYDAVTSRSETRSTLVDALDGFRTSDTAVRSVREDTTFVPRTESREKQRLGCPACKTSVYSFVRPMAGEYVQCHTIDEGGTFVPHWYHQSLRACIVCDAAAYAAFKASWYANNTAGGVGGAHPSPVRQSPVTSSTEVDPLDALPASVAGRVRLFCRSPGRVDGFVEFTLVDHILRTRERLIATAGGVCASTDEARIWAEALSQACRTMNKDEVLGLGFSHRKYLLALVAGRNSPPTKEEDRLPRFLVDVLLFPTILPAGATPASMHGTVHIGPLITNEGNVWRITEVGRQYLRSCYERQTQDGWFAREDFSALSSAPADGADGIDSNFDAER